MLNTNINKLIIIPFFVALSLKADDSDKIYLKAKEYETMGRYNTAKKAKQQCFIMRLQVKNYQVSLAR